MTLDHEVKATTDVFRTEPMGGGERTEAMSEQGVVDAANMVNEPRARKTARFREIKSGFARVALLHDLANTINKRGDQWVDDTIDLANLLKQAWDQFPDSRDGRTQWQKWVWDNIKLGESRVRELLSVAKSANPQQALMRLRLRNKERVAKHRENLINSTSALSRQDCRVDTFGKE